MPLPTDAASGLRNRIVRGSTPPRGTQYRRAGNRKNLVKAFQAIQVVIPATVSSEFKNASLLMMAAKTLTIMLDVIGDVSQGHGKN